MVHELEVWLFADRVGSLVLVDGRLSFCYAPDWLALPGALALSASLPLQSGPFDDRLTRPFFAGLLPKGRMRRLIAQQFQVSGQNDFALLDRIDGECAGAVTLLEPGQALRAPAQNDDVEWLSDEALVATLDELPRRPMLAGTDGLRLSLAGAQDKLPVVFDGARIGLPRNGTPSSHILKPAIHAVEVTVDRRLGAAELVGDVFDGALHHENALGIQNLDQRQLLAVAQPLAVGLARPQLLIEHVIGQFREGVGKALADLGR